MRYRYILIDRVIIPILLALHIPPNFSIVDNATTTLMGQISDPASAFTPFSPMHESTLCHGSTMSNLVVVKKYWKLFNMIVIECWESHTTNLCN